MAGFGHTMRVVRRATALNLRARAQYRADFVLSVLFGIAWQTATLAFVATLLGRFTGGLGDVPSAGVVLIVGMRLLGHALYVLCFSSLNWLAQMVDEGRIDGFRLRPLPVFTQVLLYQANVNAFGDLVAGASALVVGISLAPVHWTAGAVAYLVGALVGGTLLESAIQVAVSSMLLRSPSTRSIGSWIDQVMVTFGNYPLSILPNVVQGLLTWVFPLAFVAYFPAMVLLGLAPTTGPMAVVERCAPLLGPVVFVLAVAVWNRSMRTYQTAGG
jgi:ABC-2 type transport system permease protein